MRKLGLFIIRGDVKGQCPKCGEPYLGSLDTDEPTVIMECVSCHHSVDYFYRWPDELPPVTLRYRSSGQLVGHRKKPKKKKLKNKNNVLKGQLSFFE